MACSLAYLASKECGTTLPWLSDIMDPIVCCDLLVECRFSFLLPSQLRGIENLEINVGVTVMFTILLESLENAITYNYYNLLAYHYYNLNELSQMQLH